MSPLNLHTFPHLKVLIVHVLRAELNFREQFLEFNDFPHHSSFNGINLIILLLLYLAHLEIKELDQFLKNYLHGLFDAVVDFDLHFFIKMVNVLADSISTLDLFSLLAAVATKQVIEDQLIVGETYR